MERARPASRHTYAGLFMVALATLTYEILLTRIFSVTMWYHFAFVAISIAMFGMTVGALAVYLMPRVFTQEGVRTQLAVSAIAFPILMVFSFLTQLSVPFLVHPSIVAVYAIAFTYAVIALPFVASGICVSLALTRFPRDVSQLYAADLAGAGLGCVLLIYLLRITDGPTAVIAVAFLASVGAVFFAADAGGGRRLRTLAIVTAGGLGLVTAAHTALVWREFPVLRILWAKGSFEARPLYEKWNSYSRVRVSGNPAHEGPPFARSLSPNYPSDRLIRALRMDIDVNASTAMIAYSGADRQIEHLRYDVANVGHYLRKPQDVLVVGTGGGRDILAALAFGARAITGVELNRDIIAIVNGRFGDFTGHLDRLPGVRFVNDEARSYIARERRQFDLIQISLIDTWAATAAGAFALSENALYTTEAWDVFLKHLSDRGALSVTRWYLEGQPDEIYRTVVLATTALSRAGVARPRDHIVVIRSAPTSIGSDGSRVGVGTLLVSRTPIAPADLDAFERSVRDLQFEIVLSPRTAVDPVFATLTSPQELPAFTASYPVDISAPTDNRPFFFHMLRLRDIGKLHLLAAGKSTPNMMAVFVLAVLLATVTGLSALCIVLPLALASRRDVLRGAGPFLVFFAAIGLGFMLIETSQMQRLIIVLGHPTYALSVVLFALLISSGLGSYWTRNVPAERAGRAGAVRLGALVAVLVVFGLITPAVTHALEGMITPVRIAAAVLLLFPAGLLMGTAFPLGIKIASSQAEALTPWLWGINGALSVVASVLSVVIALAASISVAFWTGCAAYVIALVAFRGAARRLSATGR